MVGTARDLGDNLPRNFGKLKAALSVFKNVDFFIVESDSTDCTPDVLQNLADENPNLKFVSLGKLASKIPNRVQRIGFCRNIYVEHIRKSGHYDYIVVADLDGINNRINKKSILSCFNQSDKWDVLTANQLLGYYDLFALRAPGWNETNCFREWNKKKETLLDSRKRPKSLFLTILDFFYYDRFRRKILYKKMKFIYPKRHLIPVVSSFGGFAIYRSEIFLKFDYSAGKELQEKENCEHVYLNLKLCSEGFRIFINPRLVNSWLNQYNLNKFTVVRFYRYVIKPRLAGKRMLKVWI
jgi:hypothetical protein